MSINDQSKSWNNETLFFDGDSYFSSMLNAIDNAKSEILLESYIFDCDPIGLSVLQHLSNAKRRGVKIQIRVDGIGSFNWLTELRSWGRKNNIPVKIYHPIPFHRLQIEKLTWRTLRRSLRLFRRINRRLHRKIMEVDGEFVLIGSFNITQIHSKKYLGAGAWRDTGALLSGPEAVRARSSMRLMHRWNITGPNHLLRWNSNWLLRVLLHRDLKKRLKKAQNRVLITNAYFLPKRSVLSALLKTARRGVHVAICIPAKSDTWLVKTAAKSLYSRMLRAGIQIYEYQPSVLHAKTMIIDDWATVGSHNLNHRSLYHDLEVEAVIQTPESLTALLQQWDDDIHNSEQVKLDKMNRFERILSRIIYWFRYWL